MGTKGKSLSLVGCKISKGNRLFPERKSNTQLKLSSIIIAVSFLAFSSCGGQGGLQQKASLNQSNQSNGRITITNNDSDLSRLIRYVDEDVVIGKSEVGAAALGSVIEDDTPDFSLRLVAEVLSPAIEGETLQATSVSIKHGKAVVSYNMAGDKYLGGIQLFDITDIKRPSLNSQIVFNDTDINAVTVSGDKVYGVGATGRGEFDDPAVMEVIKIISNKMVLEDNKRIGLASYAGTSVISGTSNRIFAASGSAGGLTGVDEETFAVEDYNALDDARWVDVYNDRVAVVQGGTEYGQLSIFDSTKGSLSWLNTFTFNGAMDAEAKTTVEVAGNKAFIAAGTAGVQILSINSGDVIGTIENSDTAVANAVTVDNDLLFISGGAGVYVAQLAKPASTSNDVDPLDITLIGKLKFDDLQSVNHVAYRDKYLFVAAGLGGLKIVRVDD